MVGDNGKSAYNTLKQQPGQVNKYAPSFHPLPGEYAQLQLAGKSPSAALAKSGGHENSTPYGESYFSTPGQPQGQKGSTEIQRAIAAEKQQHEYWEEWQGVAPGKPVYEDPRAFQNTLLPTARFGTDGRGY